MPVGQPFEKSEVVNDQLFSEMLDARPVSGTEKLGNDSGVNTVDSFLENTDSERTSYLRGEGRSTYDAMQRNQGTEDWSRYPRRHRTKPDFFNLTASVCYVAETPVVYVEPKNLRVSR